MVQTRFFAWEDAFMDVASVRIMYYLAKYNPKIASKKIAESLKIDENIVRERLDQLLQLRIIRNEDHEYTLTERGIASLYNFHIIYNKK
jgi:predicted transcriptional regulator